MARNGKRRRDAAPVDLTETLEKFAIRLGDRIGLRIAQALVEEPIPAAPAQKGKQRCAHGACERAAAARGLCKSHYNLMLYHRRKVAKPKAEPAQERAPPARNGSEESGLATRGKDSFTGSRAGAARPRSPRRS